MSRKRMTKKEREIIDRVDQHFSEMEARLRAKEMLRNAVGNMKTPSPNLDQPWMHESARHRRGESPWWWLALAGTIGAAIGIMAAKLFGGL